MPNGHGLDPEVERGEVCAKCKVKFDGAHGQPVNCHTCYDLIKFRYGTNALPKAWLEEKV